MISPEGMRKPQQLSGHHTHPRWQYPALRVRPQETFRTPTPSCIPIISDGEGSS